MTSDDQNNLRLLGFSEAPSLQIPADELGPGGIQGEIHIIAQFNRQMPTDDERMNDSSLRQFKVSATLSRLPPTAGDLNGAFTEKDGNSYLVAPDEIVHHKVDTSNGSFTIRLNDAGEMSFLVLECTAASPSDAKQSFLRATLLFLDHMAYLANTPLFVGTVRVEDLKNHITHLTFTAPYRSAVVGTHASELFVEMKPIYAMYREAKNASSDFYRFLCFYKILEGLLLKMRAAARKQAKDKQIHVHNPPEEVPDSPDYEPYLRKWVGTSVKHFFDQFLTPHFRNSIAHFVTDDGTVLQMSDPNHIARFSTVMLICENCVRLVIRNHESLLRQLK